MYYKTQYFIEIDIIHYKYNTIYTRKPLKVDNHFTQKNFTMLNVHTYTCVSKCLSLVTSARRKIRTSAPRVKYVDLVLNKVFQWLSAQRDSPVRIQLSQVQGKPVRVMSNI